MKLSIDVKQDSPQAWVDTVMGDFDRFLQDHADCERKASAMAMSMVAKFPDRVEIIPELIETALEEMEHFQSVYQIMERRGVRLGKEMGRDKYVEQLLKLLHSGREQRFIDRLLMASVIECRGAERFKKVYEALPAGELKQFYHQLWASEAKHGHIFTKMALNYAPEKAVYDRLDYFMDEEAKIMQGLELRPALH